MSTPPATAMNCRTRSVSPAPAAKLPDDAPVMSDEDLNCALQMLK